MQVQPVIPLDEIFHTRKLVDEFVDEGRDYCQSWSSPRASRDNTSWIETFHPVRRLAAAIYLALAAKAWALLQGRATTPKTSRASARRARHRLILTYEAEAQAVTTDAIIKKSSTPCRCLTYFQYPISIELLV
jgi:MoxR-like ATPase